MLAVRPEIEIVGEAADGQEAVRLVTECRPDVVLMDAKVPVLDGPSPDYPEVTFKSRHP